MSTRDSGQLRTDSARDDGMGAEIAPFLPQQSAAIPPATVRFEAAAFVEACRARVDNWFTPRTVLFLFTALNFVTYFDRGAIAGCLTAIKTDDAIRGSANAVSDTQIGVVASSFMIGYMCTCPLFAALGAYVRMKHIILLGMAVWTAACLATAASTSYWVLLLSRVCVGVGEAAFVGFTVTIIDNIAPRERRTLWIGIFYSMIPVGTAIGISAGGLLGAQSSFPGTSLSPWRVAFLGEVVAAIPILYAIAALPWRFDHVSDSDLDFPDAGAPSEDQYLPLHTASLLLVKNRNYLLIVAGFAMYCFVMGAISVWAIPFLAQGPLHLPTATAAVGLGVSTSICGLVGSLCGGWMVDTLGGSAGRRGSAKCLFFSVVMIALCAPCGAAALQQSKLVPFMGASLVSMLALFSVTAPINAAILTVVSHSLRPYAVSYSVFFIHFLGDFPSPTIAGMLSDHFSKGCAELLREDECRQAPVRHKGVFKDRLCYWVRDGGGDNGWIALRRGASGQRRESRSGHCVNTYQTRDALLVIFAFLVIAVPCWLVVYSQLRKAAREEERISEVVVVDTAATPTLP